MPLSPAGMRSTGSTASWSGRGAGGAVTMCAVASTGR